MDTYTFKILTILFDEDRYVTYEYLADKIGVSLRTLKRSIKDVQNYLKEQQIPLQVQMGKGIHLELNNTLRLEEKQKLDALSIGFIDQDERILYLLCELLVAEDYLKTDYLALVLKISSGTIEKSLRAIEGWLKKFTLQLEKSRGKGIRIKGRETDKRTAIVNLLTKWIDITKIDYYSPISLAPEMLKSSLILILRKKLLSLISPDSVSQVDVYFDEHSPMIKEQLTDESYLKLTLWLSLCLSRPCDGSEESVVMEEVPGEGVEAAYKAIMEAADKSLNQEEINYLRDYYRTARRRNNVEELMMAKLSSEAAIQQIIDNIEKDLDIEFDRESEFIEHLVFHLSLFLERLQKNISVTNDFLDTIKADYTEVYLSVERSLRLLGYEVPEEEIGFISMHIVAALLEMKNKEKRKKIATICMSGISTSKILAESIKRRFPEVDVVEHIQIEMFDELELIKKGVDLIASSVELETNFLPVVLLNPFFQEKDQLALEKALDRIQKYSETKMKNPITENKTSMEEKQYYCEVVEGIIRLFHFEESVQAGDIDTFISIAGQIFGNSHEQKRKLENKFREREKYRSTIIEDEGLVLLHCCADDIRQVGVLRLKDGIVCRTDKNDCYVQAALVMIIPENENEIIKSIFSEISGALINSKDFINKLMKGSKRDIQEELGRILKNFTKDDGKRNE